MNDYSIVDIITAAETSLALDLDIDSYHDITLYVAFKIAQQKVVLEES